MGILIRNNIVNQKGNPAWYEDTLAARPIANLQGRMFVDTNNPSTGIYRDTGSSWVNVADPGAGTTGTLQQVTTNGSTTNVGISITTLTPGSILFSGTGGLISQDNTNLFWDDANNFLGIGPTGGPTALLDIHSGTQNIFIQVNATSTNNSQIAFLNGGVGKWRIGNLYNAGANDFIIYDTINALNRLIIKNTGIGTYTGTFNITEQVVTPQYLFTSSTSLASQTGGNTNIYSGSNSLIITDNTGAISIVSVNNSSYAANFKGSVTSNGLSSKSDGFFLTTTALTPNVGQLMAWYNSAGTRRAYFGYGSSGDNTFSLVNETGGSIYIGGVTNFNNAINIGNSVSAGVAVASTHKVSILIGGVQYYLLASNV